MDCMQVFEVFLGAFFAFFLGIITELYLEKRKRNARLKVFVNYIIKNHEALLLIRRNLNDAMQSEDESRDNSLREAMRRMGYVQSGDYKLYPVQADYRRLIVDLNQCRRLTKGDKDTIELIVNGQDFLYSKQLILIRKNEEETEERHPDNMERDANLVIREINRLELLICELRPTLSKAKLLE